MLQSGGVMRWLIVGLLVLWLVTGVSAQTATPDPLSESIYATLTGGQVTRFDYSATAAEVHIANLLTALLVSIWSMFFLGVIVLVQRNRR
jgi:hypothetical protein